MLDSASETLKRWWEGAISPDEARRRLRDLVRSATRHPPPSPEFWLYEALGDSRPTVELPPA